MRWYDYIMCIFFADVISAMIMAGSMFVVLPVISYLFYEDFRKMQEHGDLNE